MIQAELADIFPIAAVEDHLLLSKKGDLTLGYSIHLPEVFTLSDHQYEKIHQCWLKAIRSLPVHSIVHKQDWFLEQTYSESSLAHPHFLNQASQRHFKGRTYQQHESYLWITLKASQRKYSNSLCSTLIRPQLLSEEIWQPDQIQSFQDRVNQFKSILEEGKLLQLTPLKADDLVSDEHREGLLERYFTLQDGKSIKKIQDIQLEKGIHLGRQEVQLFSLGDLEVLPHFCGSRMTYDQLSTDKTKFPISFAAPLGLLLPCNHIYNQFLFIGHPSEEIKKLERKRLRLQSLSAYSRSNAVTRDAVDQFLHEAMTDQKLPVKAHFNLQIWSDDPKILKAHEQLTSAALAQIDAATKIETVGAPQIWWAGIPGNAGDFPMNDTFDTFAAQASCFLNQETNYQSDAPEKGIRFCDRLHGRPVYVDLFDEPRKKGWISNMGMLVCGTSGGGKSMTVNHILSTLHQQGAHCVTVDIGGSYQGLCELVKGYYFTYTEEKPICFNPFYLPEGQSLDTEKKESLKALITALWKQEEDTYQRSEYVALSNAIQGYYQHLAQNQHLFPCFNSFYDYLKEEYTQVLTTQNVKEKDFDIHHLLYVLRPYYQGGEFDFLLNAKDQLDLLNQPFIVIELDNIKDHPILFPVVTLIIMELFISKMRKLEKVRKVLTIDEAWKAIAKSGMAEFLKYAFKTIRKFNGIPIVITQELDDLVSSPIIKEAIINNADIKILMDMRKYLNKFDRLQEVLGLSEKGKSILLSVNKDQRELFIDLGGQVSKVYRNELCPEEYFAYTTEGKERVWIKEYARQYGSMERGIQAYLQTLKSRKHV